jgi:hypothetical protein
MIEKRNRLFKPEVEVLRELNNQQVLLASEVFVWKCQISTVVGGPQRFVINSLTDPELSCVHFHPLADSERYLTTPYP